jgi:hypothetical protein
MRGLFSKLRVDTKKLIITHFPNIFGEIQKKKSKGLAHCNTNVSAAVESSFIFIVVMHVMKMKHWARLVGLATPKW